MPLLNFIAYAQVESLNNHECVVDGVPTLACLEVIFGNILFVASSLVVLILFIMFVIGSFKYLVSRGDPEKIKNARGTLMYAIVGIILFVSAYLILNVVDFLFLGGKGSLFDINIPSF